MTTSSTDPVDLAEAMLRHASLLDPRTPRPDPPVLAAWAWAVEQANMPDLTVADVIAAVNSWAALPETPVMRPGTILEQARLARSRRRPPPLAEQFERDRLHAARVDAIAENPTHPALPVGDRDVDEPVDLVTAMSGPVARDEFGPLEQPDVRALRSEDSRRLNSEYVHAVIARAIAAQRTRMRQHLPSVAPNSGVREVEVQPPREVAR